MIELIKVCTEVVMKSGHTIRSQISEMTDAQMASDAESMYDAFRVNSVRTLKFKTSSGNYVVIIAEDISYIKFVRNPRQD